MEQVVWVVKSGMESNGFGFVVEVCFDGFYFFDQWENIVVCYVQLYLYDVVIVFLCYFVIEVFCFRYVEVYLYFVVVGKCGQQVVVVEQGIELDIEVVY